MTEMELEPSLRHAPMTLSSKPLLLLEELRERMASALEPSKRIPALLSHRVHRVFAVVEPRAEVWVGEDLVRLVEQRHLRLRTTLVRVSGFSGFAAVGFGVLAGAVRYSTGEETRTKLS